MLLNQFLLLSAVLFSIGVYGVLARRNGVLVLIGVMGGVKAELNLAQLMVRRQKIVGSVLRPRAPEEKGQIIANFAADVMGLLNDRRMVPLVDEIFSLEEVSQAHQLMEASGHFGKIVLQVDPTVTVH